MHVLHVYQIIAQKERKHLSFTTLPDTENLQKQSIGHHLWRSVSHPVGMIK